MIVLALALALAGAACAGRRSRPRRRRHRHAAIGAPHAARRSCCACSFAGVALGHGLPFVVEGAVFIFVFTTLFSWPTWRAERRIVRGLAQTLAIAVVASAFISWLFESVFLVRLP